MLRLSVLALSLVLLSSTAAHAAGDAGWANFLLAPLENVQAGVGSIVSRVVGLILTCAALWGVITKRMEWMWIGICFFGGIFALYAPDISNAFFGSK